jgi:hypothetical protein
MFLGDDGVILCQFHGRNPRLMRKDGGKGWREPSKTLPRSPGTLREWLDACKGGKDKPGASFETSGPVVEALLLGNVALESGRPIEWDHAGLKVVGDKSARDAIDPGRRGGWTF